MLLQAMKLAAPVKADGLGVAGAMVVPLVVGTGTPDETAVGPWIWPSLIWLTGTTEVVVATGAAVVTWI